MSPLPLSVLSGVVRSSQTFTLIPGCRNLGVDTCDAEPGATLHESTMHLHRADLAGSCTEVYT